MTQQTAYLILLLAGLVFIVCPTVASVIVHRKGWPWWPFVVASFVLTPPLILAVAVFLRPREEVGRTGDFRAPLEQPTVLSNFLAASPFDKRFTLKLSLPIAAFVVLCAIGLVVNLVLSSLYYLFKLIH